ncbi:hypothetical protein [Staphylothermus hellenicus]|uniref:Uncharacterized protein n=1 Tax=Staphylothermus hellenicus (strain DSM 12710 / JCM 10830 / BK20S6-10-b1 / P8) TaxID=591019 RepID=D7DA95_STAHD|nr:hypothetical protein [Staphylothermus hellenicus]ADI32691.1 hypothetical protein Shell_1604 [Staphylothermus hellenicus DSM 12710]
MRKTRIKTLNLNLEEIKLEDLANIIEYVEEHVREYLEQVLPPKSEYDIIVKITHEGDKITLFLDIGVKAGYIDIMNYNKILGDAINEARRIFERELRKYKQVEKVSTQ